MKYSITIDPDYTNASKVGLRLEPDDEVLRLFFGSIGDSRFRNLPLP